MFRTSGDPVLYLSNPPGVDDQAQRETLDTLNALNSRRYDIMGDGHTTHQFPRAGLPHAEERAGADGSGPEPQHILDLYGAWPAAVV